MNAQYYTPPPTSNPDFIYRIYPNSIVRDVRKLIEWSQKEYNDALRCFARRGEFNTVRSLTQNYSPMRLLAEMRGFRKMVAFLVADPRLYNSLTGRERVFVRRAYEIYETLTVH